MKQYIQSIINTFLVGSFLFTLTGCDLFGLDLQKKYDYDYEVGMYDNHINMSTWEFIEFRSDLFALLKEGIEYAGLQSLYDNDNTTFILLVDNAFNSTTAAEMSYFSRHPLINREGEEYTPTSLTEYPVEQVRELLLYHTVEGLWTWSNLPANPTWYNTYATADTAKVNLYLNKDRNPNIRFNGFEGHYKNEIGPRTTNLLSDNGSYIHVIESWLDRPTRGQLGL